MFRILVSVREKRSTATQFENASVGCDIEANNLELNSADAIVEKTKQLFVLARSAVQAQLLDVIPEHGRAEHSNGHGNGNGNSNGHSKSDAPVNGNGEHKNGNGRSYGRPTPEPTPKQKMLLSKLIEILMAQVTS